MLAEKDYIGVKDHIISEQEKRIALIEEYLRLARIRRFGASSEKIPDQGDLFDEAELEAALGDVAERLPDEDLPAKKKRSKKRQRGFSNTLPRVQIYRSLSDEEKAGASKVFYTKVKEELDIIPAQARVLEYWQEKAVFDTEQGESTLVSAARAVHPLGKCIASVALLVHIITSIRRPACCRQVETAKANGLEPYAYLSHVLANIATADTPEKLEALLPWNVNKTG